MKAQMYLLISCLIFLYSCNGSCQSQGNLVVESFCKKVGVGYGIKVNKGFAYITTNDGLAIVDVQDPQKPEKINELRVGLTFGLDIKDDYAYLIGGGNFRIVNLKNPIEPKIIQEYEYSAYSQSIKVVGHYAYIAGKKGLDILDVVDPENIKPVAHYGDIWIRSIDITKDIAYLANYDEGIEVIDISDPSSPKRISTISGTEQAINVHVFDHYLYVSRHVSGLLILDISEKKKPKIVSSFCDDDGGEVLGTRRKGEYLFVQDGSGIEVLDVSDPYNPVEITEYRKNGGHGICVDEEHIYVASTKKGMTIFKLIDHTLK